MILDTTVLIDLQRELRRRAAGRATALLVHLDDEPVAITFVTWMEFAEGYPADRRDACERFLSRFPVLWPTEETAWTTARVVRELQAQGEVVGDHDAWIAALALEHERAVFSRNERHFTRVRGLHVRSY